MKKLLTPAEAALVLGVSPETVVVYARNGRLKRDAETWATWKRLRFTPAELKRYQGAKRKPGKQKGATDVRAD